MTQRLYYTDSEVQTFEARVLGSKAVDDCFHVRLDRTAFYPTSGGQPFDTGRLNEAAVVDVIDQDDEIVHVVTKALAEGDAVRGEIDWHRRTDHVQQHTGQHILSGILDDHFGAATESFHLGGDASTIDVARDLPPEAIAAAERAANQVVWRDVPVEVRFVRAEDAVGMPLRKPSDRVGELRLVAIEGVDLSACGGTHVRSTGQVGLIAVTNWERFKGGTRITFVCGERALTSHRRLRDIVSGVSRQLSVGATDIEPAILRLQQELRQRQRDAEAVQRDLAAYRAREWAASPEMIGPHRVVLRVESSSEAAALKNLAQAVVTESGLVAVLIGEGAPVPVVVARSADAGLDAGAFIRTMTAALGGRGGGRPEMAQAGIPLAPDGIVAFVRQTLAS